MIKIENLSFAYKDKTVLGNISLTLEPGRIYGLLGENGVGKTTLLTLLCGLKKPQEGIITIDGADPYKRKPSTLREIIYIPDEVSSTSLPANGFARANGLYRPRFSMEKFHEVMELFGMDGTQAMDGMSYGELKKVWLAFALACNCRYMLMDEPTNGLDIPSKSLFRKALCSYACEDSLIVVATHQVRDLENVIDPIIILDRREVLLNAGTDEIASRLYFDYGSAPRTDALYSEFVPGGNVQVCLNNEGLDSKVSIEALFNAVMKNRELIRTVFCHE